MSIEYRSVDVMGNIYRVTDLRDEHGNPTTEPTEATCCIVHSMNERHAIPIAECPIYTVH